MQAAIVPIIEHCPHCDAKLVNVGDAPGEIHLDCPLCNRHYTLYPDTDSLEEVTSNSFDIGTGEPGGWAT